MKKLTISENRLTGFVCSACLPAMAIAFGIALPAGGVVMNAGIVVVFFVIPLITMVLIGLCIFCEGKTGHKFAISGLIWVAFLIVLVISTFFVNLIHVEYSENFEALMRYIFWESEFMPDLSETGNKEKIELYNVDRMMFIFHSETDYLICRYTQEEYEVQKSRIESPENYTYLGSPVEIDGYQFRTVAIDSWYPKQVALIGYSDNANEIVYVEYNNSELDYIDSLEEFIIDDCAWKHIR